MTEALRLLIVDDEPLARLRLRSLLADCAAPKAEVLGEAGSAAEALHLLSRLAVDGVMLDIHMPGLDGLALSKRLRTLTRPPAVVFVTAHAGHALQAFELDAVDYLTKPVRRERLHEALVRMSARLGRPLTPAAVALAPVVDEQVLVVSDRGRVARIPVSQIVYLKAEQKYVNLVTTTATLVLDDALADLEQRLGDKVLRIHRNALVSRSAIRALEKRVLPGADDDEPGESWAVQLAPQDHWLAVSRRQLAAVRELIARGGL
jgi:two-component system response regulator AlgR